MRRDRDRILSSQDVDFLLHDWLHIEDLCARDYYAEHSRDTIDGVLELAADIASAKFAPHNKRNDVEEPRFVDGRVILHDEIAPALHTLAQAGLLAATMDASVGGMQLPYTAATAVHAWMCAANVGTWGYALLTIANANLLIAHGTPTQIQRYVPPMLEGRVHGTMCLSEPQAGSSLADITTRAEPQPDGSYRLTGTKMWISGGDHEMGENIVHLVLAKVPGGPAGPKSISLFLVPKFQSDGTHNGVTLVGLNHKMGCRGTVNTVLSFEGAIGELVGVEGRGLACMFHMMNEARVGVGLGAAALAYTGYLKALHYARTRPQGRLAGSKDPSAPMVAIVEHPDVRRMLLAQKAYAEGALALALYCGRLVDEERTGTDRQRSQLLLETLTPIAKSWPSQWGLEANALAIQVHGGYGYTREYDVEQHYRDNRLNPIHEGTHGIQAADLLGRKVPAGFPVLRETIETTIARSRTPEAQQLHAALVHLGEVTDILLAHPAVDERLANATLYLEAAGHVVVAWLWLDQLLALGDRDDDFALGKHAAAQYFYRFELPKVAPQLNLLASLDRTLLDTRASWL